MIVEISYTSAALAASEVSQSTPTRNGTIGGIVDGFMSINYALSNTYYSFYSYSLTQTQLTLSHSGGTQSIYRGTLDNPSATSGYASVTSRSVTVPSVVTYTESGQSRYVYASNSSGYLQSFSAVSGVLDGVQVRTTLPTWSSDYNKTFGNSSIRLEGRISYNQNFDLSGSLYKIDGVFDKLVSRQIIEGNFSVSGNAIQIGQGLRESSVVGTLTKYTESFYDGSYVRVISQAGVQVGNDFKIEHALLASPSLFPENDVISISLPGTVQKPWVIASGAGDDRISIVGGGIGKIAIHGGAGNDVISVSGGSHVIDGGVGVDYVVLTGSKSGYTIQRSGSEVTLRDGQNTWQIQGVERLRFSDLNVGFDSDGNAGQAYRIYKAAFNRTPDAGGLGYWIAQIDAGMDLIEVSSRFIDSPEFRALYGSSPSNSSFITLVYTNVLGRAPDAGGFEWWLNAMNTDPSKTKAKVLADFSESAENVSGTAELVLSGIAYAPWNGG